MKRFLFFALLLTPGMVGAQTPTPTNTPLYWDQQLMKDQTGYNILEALRGSLPTFTPVPTSTPTVTPTATPTGMWTPVPTATPTPFPVPFEHFQFSFDATVNQDTPAAAVTLSRSYLSYTFYANYLTGVASNAVTLRLVPLYIGLDGNKTGTTSGNLTRNVNAGSAIVSTVSQPVSVLGFRWEGTITPTPGATIVVKGTVWNYPQ